MIRATCLAACLLIAIWMLLADRMPAAAITASSALATGTADDIPHIVNGAEPSGGIEIRHLYELWRAGGEDDEVLIGRISSATCDAEGRVYLLDSQLKQVLVYSPEGRYVRSLGREGEGPGEFPNPARVFLLPGDRLGVLQAIPARIVCLGLNGDPAGTIHLGEGDSDIMALVKNAKAGGGNIVLAGTQYFFGENERVHYFLDGFDHQQGRICSYWSLDVPLTTTASPDEDRWENYPIDRYAVDAEGLVYVAPDYGRYRIEVYGRDGGLERIIEREYHSLAHSDTAMVRVRASDAKVENHYPDIYRLEIAADGSLWVLPSRGVIDAAGNIAGVVARNEHGDGTGDLVRVFDVFDVGEDEGEGKGEGYRDDDGKGHFAKQVALIFPGPVYQGRLCFCGSDRFVLILDEDQPETLLPADGESALPAVICFDVR